MLKLFSFEMKKMHRSVYFWVCFAIFAVIIGAYSTFINVDINLAPTKQYTPEEIQSQEADMTEKEKEEFEAQLRWQENGNAIVVYSSDSEQAKFVAANNVNEEVGLPTFTFDAFTHTGILVIFISVLASAIFAQEFTNGTIKLSLMSGHRRDEIMGAKILTLLCGVIEILFAAAVVCLAAGIVFFLATGTPNPEPWNALKLTSSGGEYTTIPAWGKVLVIALLGIFEAILFSSFSLFISLATANVPLSIIIPIVSAVIPTFITSDKLTNNIIWRSIFFNLQDTFMMWSSPSKTLWTALVAMAVWTVLFIGASFIIFEKKDIYS